MLSRLTLGVAAAASAMLLAACEPAATTTTSAATASAAGTGLLAPVAAPRAVVGDVSTWQRMDGTTYTVERIAADATTTTIRFDSGCTEVYRKGWSAPALSRTGCKGGTSSAIRQVSGSLYPMRIGSAARTEWTYNPPSGKSFANERDCKVVGEERVTVPAGTFNTYRLRCQQGTVVRESWYTEEGYSVQFRQTDKDGKVTRLNRLVSLVRG